MSEKQWSAHNLFQDLWIWRFQLHWQPKCGGAKDASVELRLVAKRQKYLPKDFWPEMPSSTSPRKSLVISISLRFQIKYIAVALFRETCVFYSWNSKLMDKSSWNNAEYCIEMKRSTSWKLFLFLLILFTRNTKQTSIGVDKIISMRGFFCV